MALAVVEVARPHRGETTAGTEASGGTAWGGKSYEQRERHGGDFFLWKLPIAFVTKQQHRTHGLLRFGPHMQQIQISHQCGQEVAHSSCVRNRVFTGTRSLRWDYSECSGSEGKRGTGTYR